MSCQMCGMNAPTEPAAFNGNIGAIVIRFRHSIRALMCRPCVHKQFWKYTAMNLFLGWWGVISFFVTPFYLLSNIVEYVRVLGRFRRAALAA